MILRHHRMLSLTLRPGVARAKVPCHLDCISGAAQAHNHLDKGPLDRALRRWAGGGRYTAQYHAGRSLGRIGARHQGYDDTEHALGLSRTYKVELAESGRTADMLAAFRDLGMVESASHQYLAAAPFELKATALSGGLLHQAREQRDRIGVTQALAMEPGSPGIRVAVADTGVIVGHPELQGRCLAGYDTVDLGCGAVSRKLTLMGDSSGYDFNPYDEVGHGSHVAGIIGAHGWRLPAGLAGQCLLLPIRVLAAAMAPGKSKRVGIGSLGDIDAGLKVAVDLGAQVINMSFGTPGKGLDPAAPQPHDRMVAYATSRGCILVAAAGNSGKQERFYPAANPNVIAVGSVSADGSRSPFSTWGGHIDLCAPGERIVSTGRYGYRVNTGTSFAAPFVAAAAALLLSRASRKGQTLNGETVRRLLIQSATPLTPDGFSKQTGHGLLDVPAALKLLDQTLETSGRQP